MKIFYTHDYSANRGESHRLLAHAIGLYLNDRERGAELAGSLLKERSGKPYIEGFAGFSISHSNNTWALLIGDGPCGLDVQYPKKCDILSIAQRFYNKDDADLIMSAAGSCNDKSADKASQDPEAAELFFRVWARREALIKAAGTTVAAEDIPAVMSDTADYEGAAWRLSDVCVPGTEDLFAAVCVRQEEPESEIEYIEI
ncbi:MAG: 4'-phosphopantetheinyl transferase superfamily protein [Clostridiales bacterium]|nr:4'-phosphopantetheinyl transferase superfamily protein [Clostridiales bacterium]